MVEPLSLISFQLVWYVLSCLLDDAYKRTLAVNQKEYPLCGGSMFPLAIQMVL